MSNPLATIFHGDVTLEQGSDVNNFGYGDLNVNRKVIINGLENSTGINSQGAVLISGGVKIDKNAHIHENLYVLYGTSNLTVTNISTANGATTIQGPNKVDISVGAASNFITTDGNLTIKSENNTLQLYGGENSNNAVDIKATYQDGGIKLLSGTNNGGISLISGSGGIYETTSLGNISLTANNASGSFIVNSSTGNQTLTLGLTGVQDSQLKIESSGINTTNTALVINTTNTNGNIQISNLNGLGQGSITQLTGAGGYTLLTNTSGPITLTSQAATSNYTVKSNNSNQHLTLALDGATDSSLIIKSEGINDAIKIYTVNENGNILISNNTNGSTAKVDIFTGKGGFIVNTATTGSTEITTYGASSTYTNSTLSDSQDLNITVTGNTNSKVNIASSGTGTESIKLSTSHSSGGISLSAQGKVQIESADSNNGVRLATNTSGIPIHIGTSNSMTTIYGNLNVKGVTTTINSTVTTINDNITVVNNAPVAGSDGGLAIKRYQNANDLESGDVVQDTPEETGTAEGGSTTSITLSTNSNTAENYYNGWWVKIKSGTGAGQVRRIKKYWGVGSSGTPGNYIAEIYNTSDHYNLPEDSRPNPQEGMNFSTIPDNTSEYQLFPCGYVMMIWDESHDEFAFVCNNTDSSSGNINYPHYADVRLNDLTANNLHVSTINGSQADITINVELNDNSTTPVFIPDIPGFSTTYGIFMVYVKPLSNTYRAHAIFMIGKAQNDLYYSGTVVRLLSAKGNSGDQLDMQWPHNNLNTALSKPQLYYRPSPGVPGSSTIYKIKIVSL
jgi:hypothetical protein